MNRMKSMLIAIVAMLSSVACYAAVHGVVLINTTSTNATLNYVESDVSGELVRLVVDMDINNSVDVSLASLTDGTSLYTATNQDADLTLSTNSVYFNGLKFGAGNAVTNGAKANAIVIYKD